MAIISALAVVVSLGVGTVQLWPSVGWQTPNQHDADFLTAVTAIEDFRDEWKCDTHEAALLELLERQAGGDSSIKTARKIERLKDKIDQLKCGRFED